MTFAGSHMLPGHTVKLAGMLIVAGIRVHRDQVLALAAMLAADGSDRTARVLLEALTRRQQFVALTLDDKERILDVLAHPPIALTDVRGALFDELNWRREGLSPPERPRGFVAAAARRSREPGRVAWI